MKRMKVAKYFEKKRGEETSLVQARIPLKLVKSLKPFMKEYELTWTKLITGSLQNICDEFKKGKK